MIGIVDTNLYIQAIRDATFGEAFRAWHRRAVHRLALSAVVLHELLAGAEDARLRHHIETQFAALFRARGRLLAPSARTWERAAAADRALRRDKRNAARLERRGFLNDLLIALTAREIGATVLTRNLDDFSLIATVTGVRFTDVLPEWS